MALQPSQSGVTTNTKAINADMINDFEKIFNEWSEKIEQTLEEAESEKKDDKEAGPR